VVIDLERLIPMARKRANGEGSIHPLKGKNGKTIGYRVAISIMVNGSLKRVQRRRKTHADATATLQELRTDRIRLTSSATTREDRKGMVEAAKKADAPDVVNLEERPTVENFLTWWLSKVVATSSADNTWMSTRTSVKHITQRLGATRLASLNAIHVHDFIAAMDADNLPLPTRKMAFVVLKRAISYAIKPLYLMAENPCSELTMAKSAPKRIRPFSRDETKRIIDSLKPSRWRAAIMLGFLCGLRSGEIAGLQLGDIEWSEKLIRIRRQVARSKGGGCLLKSPKSQTGFRDVPLPSKMIKALKEHLKILKKLNLDSGEQLFPASRGGLLPPQQINHLVWRPILKSLGIPFRGFHHTRHTYATTSLSRGIPLAVVSKTLGHANQMITVRSYSHWMPEEKFAAADLMDKLFD
jgi:integrase